MFTLYEILVNWESRITGKSKANFLTALPWQHTLHKAQNPKQQMINQPSYQCLLIIQIDIDVIILYLIFMVL